MTRAAGHAPMRLAIITESYAPLNTSAAVQLAALARALRDQGHIPVVIVPVMQGDAPIVYDRVDEVEVIRLRVPVKKAESYARRLLYEAVMPFAMRQQWKKIAETQTLDGVIWYSPSIFHGIFARFLKRRHGAGTYLVLRDIFPDWAVDIGVMTRRNPAYWVFKLVERYQYRTADTIGVQTPGNLPFLQDWAVPGKRGVEVLHNWQSTGTAEPCSIDLAASPLAGRRIFVYAGNIGVAQHMDLFVDLAAAMQDRTDVGFVFVGRGNKFDRIAQDALARRLDNVLCFDEISSGEIPALYDQCDFGIVSLHPAHTTHNIPGKFISYVAHGLPVLAAVNPRNDLIDLIRDYDVGCVTDTVVLSDLEQAATTLLDDPQAHQARKQGCVALTNALFKAEAAATQIAASLAK